VRSVESELVAEGPRDCFVMSKTRWIVLAMVACVAAAAIALGLRQDADTAQVRAVDETHPVENSGDAADDPAIWVNPLDPERSLVLGTDKKGGLAVYDLEGNLLQFVRQVGLNNVDVRDAFPLGSASITIVAASDSETNSIRLYGLDPVTLRVEALADAVIPLTVEGMGVCLFHDPLDGAFYVFGIGRDEERASYAEQFRIDGRDGTVRASAVRRVHIGRRAEGCVSDDRARCLYVAEEREGVWRLSADPTAGSDKRTVLEHGIWGGVTTDLEGLALVDGPSGERLLVASHQGQDEFLVLDCDKDFQTVGRFTVVRGSDTDAVTNTDGIDIAGRAIGKRFPGGLLVVQDGKNDRDKPQNFKFVRWDEVLTAIGLTGQGVGSR
jgi:3-phytase